MRINGGENQPLRYGTGPGRNTVTKSGTVSVGGTGLFRSMIVNEDTNSGGEMNE
jgi:hypothetical protein